VIEQITKHLNCLIEVSRSFDLTEGSYTEREICDYQGAQVVGKGALNV
jgi:acetolactate synthase small subunit